MMSVSLRRICEDDLEKIMNWRMSPEVTRYMNTDPELTLEQQKKWLEVIRNNSDSVYRLIEIEGIPAGVIYLTGLENVSGELGWSYYIGEQKLRSMKNALSIEMSMYDYAFKILGKSAVISDVFSLNKGVIALHLLCGCEITGEVKGAVEKNGIAYDVTYMRMTKERWLEVCDKKNYERIDFGE